MKSFVEHSQVYRPYLYGLSVVFLGMIFYAAKTIFFHCFGKINSVDGYTDPAYCMVFLCFPSSWGVPAMN